jgi:hypothetical protein
LYLASKRSEKILGHVETSGSRFFDPLFEATDASDRDKHTRVDLETLGGDIREAETPVDDARGVDQGTGAKLVAPMPVPGSADAALEIMTGVHMDNDAVDAKESAGYAEAGPALATDVDAQDAQGAIRGVEVPAPVTLQVVPRCGATGPGRLRVLRGHCLLPAVVRLQAEARGWNARRAVDHLRKLRRGLLAGDGDIPGALDRLALHRFYAPRCPAAHGWILWHAAALEQQRKVAEAELLRKPARSSTASARPLPKRRR